MLSTNPIYRVSTEEEKENHEDGRILKKIPLISCAVANTLDNGCITFFSS